MAPVQIYKAIDGHDAYLLKAMLDGAGIASEVRGEHLMGLAGAIPITDSKPTVWVAEEDLGAARDLLVRFQEPATERPDWSCATCGESNPSTFGVCWSCGTALQLQALPGGKEDEEPG